MRSYLGIMQQHISTDNSILHISLFCCSSFTGFHNGECTAGETEAVFVMHCIKQKVDYKITDSAANTHEAFINIGGNSDGECDAFYGHEEYPQMLMSNVPVIGVLTLEETRLCFTGLKLGLKHSGLSDVVLIRQCTRVALESIFSGLGLYSNPVDSDSDSDPKDSDSDLVDSTTSLCGT